MAVFSVGARLARWKGFYYYGAKYYAAWIGRFISIDPLAEKFPQLTPYNYAGNKPITHKDLEGLQGTGGDEGNGDDNSNKKGDPTIVGFIQKAINNLPITKLLFTCSAE